MTTQRVAIVTGSNKGIGLAIVRALCKQFNGDVYLTARDEKRGEEAVKALEGEGLKPKFHKLDVIDNKSIIALKEYMVERHGGVDALIHNAAIAYKGKDKTPFAEQAKVTISTNFDATVNLCKAFMPILKTDGRLVILSSFVVGMYLPKCSSDVQAFFTSANLTEDQLIAKMDEFVSSAQKNTHGSTGFANSAYAMSKIGVSALTRILAREAALLDVTGVLVNCADPGWVRTDMSSGTGNKTPDEGAETAVFLALLPKGAKEPNGEMLSGKKKSIGGMKTDCI